MNAIESRLGDALARNFHTRPDNIAIRLRREEPFRDVTWRELYLRSQELVAYFRGHGATSGERVGIAMHDNLDCIASVYAAFQCGLVVVPLDSQLSLKKASGRT